MHESEAVAPPRNWATGLGNWATGLGTGLLAGIIMAMFAMIAGATYLNKGFFTPLYMIGAPFAGTEDVMTSIQHARSGNMFWFSLGAALSGAAVHAGMSAFLGLAFGVVAGRPTMLNGAIAGITYALVVMLLTSFVVLPITAAILGGGSVVNHMPSRVGWPTWVTSHVIYGLVLGSGVSVLRQRTGQGQRPLVAA
jgi:hypothetical protein